jgi:hypothetical protein
VAPTVESGEPGCDARSTLQRADLSEGAFRATTHEDIRGIWRWLEQHGKASQFFDVVAEGETPAEDPGTAAELVSAWAEVGCTWWIETRWQLPHESDERMREVLQRVASGPPTH